MNKFVFYKIRKLFAISIFLFFSMFSVQAQNTNVTIDVQNVTLEDVMTKLKDQTHYLFANKNVDIKQSISVDIKNLPLTDALDIIFAPLDVKYIIEGTNIILANSVISPLQNKSVTVSGVVLDSKGQSIIGASVVVKGTSIGTSTNVDGSYSLQIPALVASTALSVDYLGYETLDVIIGSRTTVDIILKESALDLDAVVVTALGIKRSEKALSYNVQKVDGEDVLAVKDANFINSLNGKVAGLNINSSSAGVGGASKVVMRGPKGIDQSSNALYVIDGMPMISLASGEADTEFSSRGVSEAIADINPEDIESISVLTGASAAALYGSAAANGAIIVTTKKGHVGQIKVTVSSNTEFLTPFVMPKFQNRYGTGDLASGSADINKSWGSPLNESNYIGYSPADDYLETGSVLTQAVSISTGTDRNQTYVSAASVNSKGMVPNNTYDRYNFTFRNTTSFLDDKMTFDFSASYIKQHDRNMVNQGNYGNSLLPAYLYPRGTDWDDITMFERWNPARKISTQYWPVLSDYDNPYWSNYRNIRENDKDRYMLNASLNYEILDWLNVSGRVRMDNTVSEYAESKYATTHATLIEGSPNGLYGIATSNGKQTYADALININKTFNDFSLHANIGASLSDLKENTFSNRGPIRADGLPNLFNVYQLDNALADRKQTGWGEQTQAVFASVEVGFKDTYYLSVTGRNDWPSQLSGPHSTQSSFFYPSVGGSVLLSEVIALPEQISYLKLRGSFASVGLPFPRYIANPTYEWKVENQVWETKSHYPMYELKPERTDSWEIGLTARFLKHFNMDLSYYNATTYNQTFDPDISVSSGYSELYVQTGNVNNRGIELSLGYDNTWNKFSWSTNYTFSTNTNEIVELLDNYTHPETGELITMDRLDVGGLSNARFILKPGGTLGDLYSVVDVERDGNGNVYIDDEGNAIRNNKAGDIKLGSVLPDANMAWRNDFAYGNLNFSFLITARLGGIVYSATQSYLDYYGVSETTAMDRDNGGVIVNGNNTINPQGWYNTIAPQSGIPQFYTYSATNVRLQEVSLGYTVPRKMLGNVADVTISLVGRNLLMIYNKAPFDPESIATTGNYYQGIDFFMMPSSTNIGFNVRLKF